MTEEEITHQEKMLAFAKKVKRKAFKLPPPPLDDDDEEGVKTILKVFNIETAPRHELDKEFVRKKIEATNMRTMAYAMDIARIREELIEKKLVEKQLAFLLVALRQKIMAIPSTYARKFLHKDDLKEIHNILQTMSIHLLNDIKSLPMQVTDPNWLATLEEEEDKLK
jgi:hypothetical protein